MLFRTHRTDCSQLGQSTATPSVSDASSTLKAESASDENVTPQNKHDTPSAKVEGTGQPFVDALSAERDLVLRDPAQDLQETEMLTENRDIANKSTKDPLVDLFYELEDVASEHRLSELLQNAWQTDPLATLKLIWNARSIHLGKSSRVTFYRCCGWLADHHPLTLLANLRWVTRPTIPKKVANKDGKDGGDADDFEMVDIDELSLEDEGNPTRFDVENGVAHGYWKDLLNILALAANNQLRTGSNPASVLNDHGAKNERVWDTDKAKDIRKRKADERFKSVQASFEGESGALYKALHLSVARLFGEQLKRDLDLVAAKKMRQLSLAAKWAPSAKGFHDKHTLIVSTIAEYMFSREELLAKDSEADREHYLKLAREAYRIQVISPLRKALEIVERDITEGTYCKIRYDRLPSLAMNNYSPLFIEKDYERFAKYIEGVSQGMKRISGATLLPSTLVAQCRSSRGSDRAPKSKDAKQMMGNVRAQLDAKVADGQWKSLVQRIKDSGKIENSIAVCDVSGSMFGPVFKDGTTPIDSSLGLSLLLAEVTQPPFGGYFITFSERPEILKVGGADDDRGLSEKLSKMERSKWGMNTNFVAVFEDLLLPMALKHKVKPEDMVKQVFVFSDMQFDFCGGGPWKSSFDRIKTKFAREGYEVPQIVFWNLAGGRAGYGMYGTGTYNISHPTKRPRLTSMRDVGGVSETAPKPATIDDGGVALVSGYSQGQLKMFLENGHFDEPEEEVKEKAGEGEDADAMVVTKDKKKMEPLAMVMKAISHRSYAMLRVVD